MATAYDTVDGREVEEARRKLSLLKTKMASRDFGDVGVGRRAGSRPRQTLCASSPNTASVAREPPPPPSSSSSSAFSGGGAPPYGDGSIGWTEFEEEGSGDSQRCPHCERSFANPSTYSKHVKICETVFFKKRDAVDAASQRRQDIEKEHGSVPTTIKDKKQKKKKQDFRTQSEAFRAMIKAARETDPEKVAEAQAVLAALPPDPSKVACPHCDRKFNAESADRHIAVCARVFTNKPKAKAGAGVGKPTAKGKASASSPAKGKAKSKG
eukprot:GHVN01048006.1.p1 GENE.GHVN01048006.1~~GHVN01048006.1.p1  ORF type:complete len:299 (-),score=34.74 GHVN01048006.1:299-1102(-)